MSRRNVNLLDSGLQMKPWLRVAIGIADEMRKLASDEISETSERSGFELRQVRGSRFDLLGVHLRRDGGHRTGLRGFPLGARLEFVEPIHDELGRFGRNTWEASTATFSVRGMTAKASRHVRRALLSQLHSREHHLT